MLKRASEAGIPYDGIGIQAHHPFDWAFPLSEVRSKLELYATLGKKLHISELAFASNNRPVLGSPWRGTWSEDVQAAYAEDYYRVAFAHPAVASITWWLVVSDDEWRAQGELLRADLTPKPVYKRLDHLINQEWNTKVEARTNENGEVEFSGFFGRYEIRIGDGPAAQTSHADLGPNGGTAIELRVPAERELIK